MRNGTLFYNAELDRMDIAFSGGHYDGTHCGECLDVNIYGAWIPVRMEYDGPRCEWYLIGRGNAVLDMPLEGLPVRIC